ncbi:MAG: response regulator [Syntrophaceae bacterium]|nr:response regulator [Syntrophaceae bacterium]
MMEKWLLADLHIHTTFSDGTVPLEEVVKLYGESGFDVIAITDHLFDTESDRSLEIHEEGKSIKDAEDYFCKIEEVSTSASQNYDLLVIPGLEICNLGRDFHLLGLDLKESINPNQDAEAVIREIQRQGGLAVASHPPLKLSFFLQQDYTSIQRHPLHLWKFRKRYADKIDAWEIANREDLFEAVALEQFPFLANSDFHERNHLTSWKSLIFSEKEKVAIKKAILARKVAIFFFNDKGTQAALSTLPIKERATLEEKDMDAAVQATILIVDDERDLVQMLAYNLEKRGYRVIKAYDGFEAWEKIESERPDLVILDLMMPNLDGWELCKMIRRSENKATQEMGILMLTAKAMTEDKVYGLEIGADDYLSKPFSLNELILRVAKLIQKQSTLTQLREEIGSLGSLLEKKESKLKTLAHDLKSPLISIGFSAKRMLRKHQNEEMTEPLKTIYDSSLHLTRWVDEALSSQDLSSSAWKKQIKEVDIRSLVQQVIDLLKESSLEKRIEIELKTSSSIPLLSCHEPFMYRALVNLLSNAVKYTPRGGAIEVSIHPYFNQKGTGVLEISFRDTGIGICEEDREKIFQPYYRGKNVSSEEGKGLGLAFVKEVIELHGGKILVQSEPNVGSIFSILLPIKDVPQEENKNMYQEESSP